MLFNPLDSFEQERFISTPMSAPMSAHTTVTVTLNNGKIKYLQHCKIKQYFKTVQSL
jgi:hypothetical protein